MRSYIEYERGRYMRSYKTEKRGTARLEEEEKGGEISSGKARRHMNLIGKGEEDTSSLEI